MSSPLRLGIAGLGTVGIGVVNIVQKHADLLAMRSGRPVAITAICARDKMKNRDADLSAYRWEDNAMAVATADDVDVFIELVGGDSGVAKYIIEAALKSGKDVVTATSSTKTSTSSAVATVIASSSQR